MAGSSQAGGQDVAMNANDTIVAIATAPGAGGVGIVRLSGPAAKRIAETIAGKSLLPRTARHARFLDADGDIIDDGIAVYFMAPASYTGEDVAELQAHGSPVLLRQLVARCIALGSRQARAGEFSERAFLNGKLDLAQAEAVADLIAAAAVQAARAARRSLDGVVSQRVEALMSAVLALRVHVEAAIDFADEPLETLGGELLRQRLDHVIGQVVALQGEAERGRKLRDGLHVVLVGPPNAGKSSLLNALAGSDRAIVTEIAGTTRDILREHIHIDGMPLHVVDTAGLRDTDDQVEKIGVERALKAISEADRVLLVVDATAPEAVDPFALWPEFLEQRPDPAKVTLIRNKADLTGEAIALETSEDGHVTISLSAKSAGDGLELLREHLKACMGYEQTSESSFSARRRHLEALRHASAALEHGRAQLTLAGAGELLAEDLRQAQQLLGEITGAFSSDDLLGRIFSSFCIGK